MESFDVDVDLSGLRCPLPVLRVKKALGDMPAGKVLRVLATDPGARDDIPAFVKMAGHAMKGMAPAASGGDYFFILKQ